MIAKRISIYILGNLFLATGFIFNANSGLGISPINVVAYSVSVLTKTTFSDMTMCLFFLSFFLALIIRGKKPHWTDLLQLPYCFLFSRVMSVVAALMPHPETLAVKIIFLCLGFMCVGTGATLTLNMNIIPNPVDFLINAISNRIHKSLGFTKNIIDVTMVAITCIIALIAGISIPSAGVGIGTLVAMIFTGRWIAVVNHFFLKKLKKTREDVFIKIFDEKGAEQVT